MAYASVAYASHAYGFFAAPVFPFALVGAFVLAFPAVGRPAATGAGRSTVTGSISASVAYAFPATCLCWMDIKPQLLPLGLP